MAGFEAEPLNVFEKRNQQIADSRDKSLQFVGQMDSSKDHRSSL